MIIYKKQSYVIELISLMDGTVQEHGRFNLTTQQSIKTAWYFLGIAVYTSKQIVKIGD